MLQRYKNITEFLGSIPAKHPIIKLAPLRPEFVAYFDELLGRALRILDDFPTKIEQLRTLRSKLCDANGFFAAVTEVEVLIHLAAANFTISIEPLYPSRGPDFLVAKGESRCFVEVRSIGPDEYEIRLDLKFDYLAKKMEKIESRYALHFRIPPQFGAYTPELKAAVNAALKTLGEIEGTGKKESALYYFGQGDCYVSDKNLHFLGYDAATSEEELEIQSRAVQPGTFSVDYQRVSDEPKTGLFAFGDEPRWLEPQTRIKTALNSKIDQMVKGERNVIVLDISHANVTETNVADALYGSVGIEIGINPLIGTPAILGQTRRDDGFFRNTTRVQAVVSVRRVASGGASMETLWTVFPTSNTNATARFTASELEQFGIISAGTESLAL